MKKLISYWNLVGFSFFYVKAWSSVHSPCLWSDLGVVTDCFTTTPLFSFCLWNQLSLSCWKAHPCLILIVHVKNKKSFLFSKVSNTRLCSVSNHLDSAIIMRRKTAPYHGGSTSELKIFSGDELRVWLWCSLLIVVSVMTLHTAFRLLLELHFDWSLAATVLTNILTVRFLFLFWLVNEWVMFLPLTDNDHDKAYKDILDSRISSVSCCEDLRKNTLPLYIMKGFSYDSLVQKWFRGWAAWRCSG